MNTKGIEKGDVIIYTPKEGEVIKGIATGFSEYHDQERINFQVLDTEEVKIGMSLSRCEKADGDSESVLSTGDNVNVSVDSTETIAKGIEEVEYSGEVFKFGSIEVKKRKPHKLTQHLIPSKRSYIIEDDRKEDFEDIFDSVNENENILLVGEPGCGKSEFVLYLANLCNIPVVQVQGDGEMSVVDMIGGFQYSEKEKGTYWVDGIIPYALRHKCWILFDEINMTLPEVLARLHSVLDDRRHLDLKEINQILPRSDETIIIGTMNPSDDGRHVGTKPLSPALWSRFNLIVNFEFLSPKEEQKLLVERTGVSDKDAKIMITVASEARKGFRNNEVTEVVDTRMLLSWAKKTNKFGLKRGLKNTILSRLDTDSIQVLRGVLMSYGVVEPEGKK